MKKAKLVFETLLLAAVGIGIVCACGVSIAAMEFGKSVARRASRFLGPHLPFRVRPKKTSDPRVR